MRALILAAAIGLSVPLAACGSSSADANAPVDPGPRESRSFAGEGFTAVVSAGPDRVIIRRGSEFAISASASRALLDKLDISVEDNSLRIGRERGINSGNLGTAVITVTMPRLSNIVLAGSGEVQAERLDGGDASVTLAGSGDLTVRDAGVDDADITLAGSGNMVLAGRANAAKVTVAGSGNITAPTFGAYTADVTVAGSGNVAMSVSRTADISIIGSGDVNLTGGAQCSISRRGSGSASCAP
jgi:hypothetical protein